MGPDHAAWAGRMHVLEGWLGSTGVTHALISPEAGTAPGAPKTAARTRCWRYLSWSCSHQQRSRQESTRLSTRHMVGRLLVPSRPAHLSRVPAGMEKGPGSASDDSWKTDEKGAAHLPHGRWRSPLHCLKALDEPSKMGRKRTDGCSQHRHERREGLGCQEYDVRFEYPVHR